MSTLRIGVVGYSAQKFDILVAQKYLSEAFNLLAEQHRNVRVVSGLTDQGIPAIAYREATKRHWKTVGIACKKAVEYPCYAVDETVIIGDNWGDESTTFLGSIDVLVRVGGGKQSLRETTEARAKGLRVIEYELPAQ